MATARPLYHLGSPYGMDTSVHRDFTADAGGDTPDRDWEEIVEHSTVAKESARICLASS